MPTRTEELERFKSDINLTEYVAAEGYQLVRPESSRNSVMMVSGGDKIIIARNQLSGHWIYFSVRDDADNGTIVDFVQNRKHYQLGEVRKQLRPWVGLSAASIQRPAPSDFVQDVQPVGRDMGRVIQQYSETEAIDGEHRFLTQHRVIPPETLRSPRFAGKIRIDKHHNAVFPHHNAQGLCGFEKKNRDFTGFASGGAKGIWASGANKRDHTLVITEGAIDALSYFSLFRPPQARYISIGGEMNPEQPVLIERAIKKLPPSGKLIFAVDSDDGGDKLLASLRSIAAASGRTDLEQIEHRPEQRGDDWNDVLRQRARHPAPSGRAR